MNRIYAQLLTIIVIITLFSCKQEDKVVVVDDKAPIGSTKKMVDELKSIALDESNINIWHLNKLRANAIDNSLKTTQDPGQFISLTFKSGTEWLNSGNYDLAIERFSSILAYVENRKMKLPEDASYTIKEMLGMAYLRKAEIENCLQNHNAFSCIVPIEKEGQHVKRDGAENALKIFRDLLSLKDAKWQTKWLYNITHMTLGSYPSGVEKEYLISESIFKSDVNIPRFNDVAMSLGVAVNDISGSVVMDDFNNDGYLDLMVSSYGLNDQLRYFQNDTKGGFTDRTETSGLNGLWSGLNMVQADYDNDGWIDVLVLRGAWLGKDGNHPNSLLRNNGDGTFKDVTRESDLYTKYPSQTASWADFNNDGWIDLFIGNEHTQNNKAPSQLFQNNGDGTFTNVALEKGIALEHFIKGCVWGDYNNDGLPDLYVSLINEENKLFKNGGPDKDFKFTDEALTSKTSGPERSFPCLFFDFNQDGWEDIFVSGFDFGQFESAAGEVAKDYLGLPHKAELPKLYENNRDGTFKDITTSANIDKVLFTMGCNFGDLNNDGFPDLYAATGTPDFRAIIPNRMFLNSAGKEFLDVTSAGGFGHLQKGHGVAFGDLDSDGDQDVYNVLGGSYDGDNFMNTLYLNPGNENNWLKLKLIGTTSNKAAIGARVKVTAVNKQGLERDFYRTVNSGGSFGANPLLIELGLEKYDKIVSIEIKWPGDTASQILEDVEINSYIKVIQGNEQTEVMKIAPLDFNKSEHKHS
ncbi:CRTAC1 family protein [Dokdonia sinensis]|nr:CRTAC1 family protein [Dokdonia sinensis]